MSAKLKQIESRITAMGGAAFQEFCDAYLRRKGYESINPLGRVPGRDQVRTGTPDTWIEEADGRFVFAEYTTDRTGLVAKIQEDLAKCANEDKTGIPVARIREVVYCHTGVLKPEQQAQINDTAQALDLMVTVYGLGTIAQDLYQRYRGLARDFLGVEVDTGQILPPDEYVEAYGRSALATPLDTEFLFRSQELKALSDALEVGGVVVLSGRPGTGKTRLALEAMRGYAEAHPGTTLQCIYNRGPDLFEDLRIYLGEPGSYVVLIDDANRVSGFDYLLQLLHENRPDRDLRLVVTVRDYALGKVRETLRPYGIARAVEVGPLTGNEIRELAERAYGIRHGLFLERIEEIARGNARLAVMACRVAQETGSLDSILDATELYRAFFDGVRRELSELGNPDVIRAAGLVAFQRVVDRADEVQMEMLGSAFGLDPERFWEAVRTLHQVEILDLYEDELAKVSDQVLGTYMFYLAVFETRELDLVRLLEHYFPGQRHRIVDALGGVTRTLQSPAVGEQLSRAVEQVWTAWSAAGEHARLLELMHTFWAFRPGEVLLYASEEVRAMPHEPRGELVFRVKQPEGTGAPTLLGLLSAFSHGSPTDFRLALELLLDYAERRSSELPGVLHTLVEGYGFGRYSALEEYQREKVVLEAIRRRAEGTGDVLFASILGVVASEYLRTEFDRTEASTGDSISVIRIRLSESEPVRALRDGAFSAIAWLYEAGYVEAALRAVEGYTSHGRWLTEPEVAAADARALIPFLLRLPREEVRICVLVQDYLDQLDRLEVPYDDSLRAHFSCPASALGDVLLVDRREVRGMSWEERTERYQSSVLECFGGHGERWWAEALEQLRALLSVTGRDQSEYQVANGLGIAFRGLAAENPERFVRVLRTYLTAGEFLQLAEWAIVRSLVDVMGAAESLAFLREHEFPRKGRWISTLFTILHDEETTATLAAELLDHLEGLDGQEVPADLRFLERYRTAEPAIWVNALRRIVPKVEGKTPSAHAIAMLFNSQSEVFGVLPERFAGEVSLLQEAYIAADAEEVHLDYDGRAFAMLTELDETFPLRYLERRLASADLRRRWRPRHDSSDRNRFGRLWSQANALRLIRSLIELAYERESRDLFVPGFLSALLGAGEEDGNRPMSVPLQDKLLTTLIEERAHDGRFMTWLFDTIARLSPDRYRAFLGLYLAATPPVEDFAQIQLSPAMWTGRGSVVPAMERSLEFLQSLLPLFDRVELLHHRAVVQSKVESLAGQIRERKRSDFRNDR